MDNPVSYNEATHRYEMPAADGLTVFARVRREGNIVYIDYVEAPEALRGTGAAGKFMEGLMQHLRAENLKAVPICGYAVSWLKRHAEHSDLLAG